MTSHAIDRSEVLVFIDSRIDDLQRFVDGVIPEAKVHILDAEKNGIQQITDILMSQRSVDAIHIVSHGSPGCLYLGESELSLSTIHEYADTLRHWRSIVSLSSHRPSLYLYGCNLAAGDAGDEFVRDLYDLTHLPIYASKTKTGHIRLEGDWNFEVEVGHHQRSFQIPLLSTTQAEYIGVFDAQLVKDINPGDASYAPPYNLTAVEGQLFFTATDGESGRELWVSDGTEEGTRLVKDINSNNDNYYPAPYSLTAVGDQLFFTADNGEVGRELWVSDGTEDGTRLVKDINPGNGSSYYYYYPAPNDLTAVGSQLFFTASDGESGRELWVSDGTEEGTRLVKDINPSDSNYSGPYALAAFGDQLFFTADDGEVGRELWVSDGSEEGTRLVKDINPSDSNYSGPYSLTEVGNQLFFVADDGESGRELWVSDGTEEGTRLVKDITPDNDGYYYYYPAPNNLTAVGSQLFFTASDGETGQELWVSDGTEEGTRLVKDINPGSDSNYYYYYPSPSDLTAVGSQLFFTANDGETGRELWVSDGTEDGTRLVKDIRPNNGNYSSGSYPSDLIEAGGRLYFTANDGETGTELWVSDGTESGTQLVVDIFPGENTSYGYTYPNSSSPGDLTVVGQQLLFTANDGQNGRELWRVTLPDNVIIGDDDDNALRGTADNDLINGLAGEDALRGLAGNDTLNGGDDNDTLSGGAGNDLLNGGSGQNQLFGDRGNDTLQSGDGSDTLDGGSGKDTARFSSSVTANLITGVASFESSSGESLTAELISIENLTGSSSSDSLSGDNKANVLSGQAGNDVLSGKNAGDTLLGDAGNDLLNGGGGRDSLSGGSGRDTLIGGNGVDTLNGGRGDDVLQGGKRADVFYFGDDLLDNVEDTDVIRGFQSRDSFDFDDYLNAGGMIEINRVRNGLLRIDLNGGEDIVNVFGSKNALNVAETQLNELL